MNISLKICIKLWSNHFMGTSSRYPPAAENFQEQLPQSFGRELAGKFSFSSIGLLFPVDSLKSVFGKLSSSFPPVLSPVLLLALFRAKIFPPPLIGRSLYFSPAVCTTSWEKTSQECHMVIVSLCIKFFVHAGKASWTHIFLIFIFLKILWDSLRLYRP